jgi:hypothetical protein
MILRKEEKIKFHISDYLKIKKLIIDSGGKEIYKKRKILSLYFDNKNLSMYEDSEEGSLPRYKIRLRNYPNDNKKKWFLEKKITSVEGKFKEITEKDVAYKENLKHNGIYDSLYGNCYPQVWVSYYRQYFLIKNERITIDQKIEYQSYKGEKYYKDNESLIIELKSSKIDFKELFNNHDLLPLYKVRFSKYCNAMNNLINKNEYQRQINT